LIIDEEHQKPTTTGRGGGCVEKPNMDKELPVDVIGSSYSYSVKGKEQAKMKEAKEPERRS
jgi:hypothetical protein